MKSFILLLCVSFFAPVIAQNNIIEVPDDYNSIQEAINKSNIGDTIIIQSGQYYEDPIINHALSLIGNGTLQTQIIGQNPATFLIYIHSDNVNLIGLNLLPSKGISGEISVGGDGQTALCIDSSESVIISDIKITAAEGGYGDDGGDAGDAIQINGSGEVTL